MLVGMPLSLDEMRQTVCEWLAEPVGPDEVGAQASALLYALDLPHLLDDLALAERVIIAADGFHPVARFFAEDSEERKFILDILRREPHWGSLE